MAALVLKLGGWTPEGDPPDLPRYVIVAAPHTSWWDGLWMVAMSWFWGLHIRWIVKGSLGGGPIGWILSSLGAVPVERSTPQGQVTALANVIKKHREILLAIAPEGTRARREHWRSGFYHIAREAGVPLCLSYLDYGRRRGGFGPSFTLTGNVKADMDVIRAFYGDMQGCYPDKFTPPHLREEDEPTPAAAPESEAVPEPDPLSAG
jgi:1-acyl-sn-glycerol-3-phosphate acyltransferase